MNQVNIQLGFFFKAKIRDQNGKPSGFHMRDVQRQKVVNYSLIQRVHAQDNM